MNCEEIEYDYREDPNVIKAFQGTFSDRMGSYMRDTRSF